MRLNRLKISILILFSFLAPYLIGKTKQRSQPTKEITFLDNKSENAIIYLFVHGLGATGQQAKRYEALMNQGAIAYFNFSDAKTKPNDYHRSFANLGQESDVARLKEVYDSLIKEHPEHSIVLIGVSRGAVTIINFMAQHKPEKVKALILESPFDTYKTIIDHLIHECYLNWIPGVQKFGEKLFCLRFPAFKKDGLLPINQINYVPHVPMLFVHSCKDELIPVKSSHNLIHIINDRTNVHLVTVKSARHAHIIVHEKAKYSFEYAVHAFYKKYNLPCDATKAEAGEDLLN